MDLKPLETHWKYVAALAGIALAFGAGRFSAPTKVQTHEETHKTQATATVQAVAVQHTDAKEEVKERIVYRDRTVIKYPDGKVEQRNIERTDTEDKHSAQTTNDREDLKAEAHSETVDKVADKVVTRDAPRVTVSGMLGTDLSLNPIYGAQIQYRMLGPVVAGAWFLSGPRAEGGLSLGLQF